MRNICDKVSLIQTTNDNSNWSSDKRCYKALEDSGGGGKVDIEEFKNHFMIHGINLRSRPPKLTIKTSRTKSDTNKDQKKQLNLLIQPKPKDFIKNSSKLKPIAKKELFPILIPDIVPPDGDKPDKNASLCKLNRKPINKTRNETAIANINFKVIFP